MTDLEMRQQILNQGLGIQMTPHGGIFYGTATPETCSGHHFGYLERHCKKCGWEMPDEGWSAYVTEEHWAAAVNACADCRFVGNASTAQGHWAFCAQHTP